MRTVHAIGIHIHVFDTVHMQRARQVAPGSSSILALPAQSGPLTFWLHSDVRPSDVIDRRAVKVPLPPRLTVLTTAEPPLTEKSPDWSMFELLPPVETTRKR